MLLKYITNFCYVHDGHGCNSDLNFGAFAAVYNTFCSYMPIEHLYDYIKYCAVVCIYRLVRLLLLNLSKTFKMPYVVWV